MADKKDKKKKGDDKTVTVSIAAHPRAKAGIRRARTRAAFGAFMLVLALNLIGNQELFDAVWRALLAGIVVNVIVWRCAIVVWKHIIVVRGAPGGGAADRALPRAPGGAEEARGGRGRAAEGGRRSPMPEPIYRITREDGVREIPRVERQRLLTPAEREEARRRREEARGRKVAKRTDEPTVKDSSQGHAGGVDYSLERRQGVAFI